MLDENDKSPAKQSAPEVRAQLERILASRCFEQAGRASRFLRYAVEQTLVLRALGMSHTGRGGGRETLSVQGGAELLWGLFMVRLQGW